MVKNNSPDKSRMTVVDILCKLGCLICEENIYFKQVAHPSRYHFPSCFGLEVNHLKDEDLLHFSSTLHCGFGLDMECRPCTPVTRLEPRTGRIRNTVHQYDGLQAPQRQHQADWLQKDRDRSTRKRRIRRPLLWQPRRVEEDGFHLPRPEYWHNPHLFSC